MDNVINLDLRRKPVPDKAVTNSDLSERLERIRSSLEKVHNLMATLKKMNSGVNK